MFLEAAGALANRMAAIEGNPADRAEHGLRLALIRPIQEGESLPLTTLLQDVQKSYSAKNLDATSLIHSSRTTTPNGMSDAEFASWIVVANTILNLDEFLTRN